MSYISRHEVLASIIGHIDGDIRQTFKAKDLRPYFDCSPTAISQHLHRMMCDGILERVSMGVYLLLPSPISRLPVSTVTPEETPEETPTLSALHETHLNRIDAIRRDADDLILEEKLRFAEEVSAILRRDA